MAILKMGQELTLKTLKKCSFKEDFSAATDEHRYLMSLVCKDCCDSSAHIRNEARLRRIKN